ncbi:hypothetical protein EVAR_92346_1 [Eumeta japonica]|uniref:Uncharacterized protein n=1 Tax=Eumeta variegata TaxID=151549 RepID=A0A4C1TLM4_EUMVA|nr:hypothetical protein EVAR_92346_1 [Eumeta japonica]
MSLYSGSNKRLSLESEDDSDFGFEFDLDFDPNSELHLFMVEALEIFFRSNVLQRDLRSWSFRWNLWSCFVFEVSCRNEAANHVRLRYAGQPAISRLTLITSQAWGEIRVRRVVPRPDRALACILAEQLLGLHLYYL